jgi:hypothetical protein
METIVFSKNICVKYRCDVAVFGAGMAGVSAAVAAAKRGAEVLLVERFAALGGVGVTGGVHGFCGNTIGQGEVFDEIVAGLEAFSAIAPVNPYKSERGYHHEILAVVLQEICLKYGVKLLLHTRLADVIAADGHIEYCVISGASGLLAVTAKQYIDCTGEGLVARYAGFGTMKGDESCPYQLPMSMMFFVQKVSENKAYNQIPEGWFEPIDPEAPPMLSVRDRSPLPSSVKLKVPMFDSTDTESLTNAEIAGRRRMMASVDYYQRVKKEPFIFESCSPIIGIREGSRIKGDYILNVDDLRGGRIFDDVIAVGTFYLDGHKPDDDKRTYILPKDSLHVPPYGIPLRSLTAADSDNLTMAGRCLSADRLALSSARVMTTCSMTGQAAGITAAMASKKGCGIRDIPVKSVQDELLQKGAMLDTEHVKSVYFA